MMGVGVNSDAGVVGNIVVDERNFDWTRFPTSWEDFRNGSAWRGAGQRFRIDASPGSEVSRYMVSFQEPYLFDRPVSLGLSGSYYDRRFNDWDEQRMGGRVSLGYQWVERDLSAIVSYRGENINIHDPSVPLGLVPELDEALGDNVLHGFKLTLINDTRDNAFLATQGHYFEVGGEQVIGTFDYPRVDLDFRKYFMLYERPDHSGRHVLSLSTTIGYSGQRAVPGPDHGRRHAARRGVLRLRHGGAERVDQGLPRGAGRRAADHGAGDGPGADRFGLRLGGGAERLRRSGGVQLQPWVLAVACVGSG
jgi:outer membrane protein insertion porin family